MKKRTKELLIIIPLVAISVFYAITFWIPVTVDTIDREIISTDTMCQEGWFQYNLETGILCSKTELTESQLKEYE